MIQAVFGWKRQIGYVVVRFAVRGMLHEARFTPVYPGGLLLEERPWIVASTDAM